MNNPVLVEYVTSFAETSQAMMQQLATTLLTAGDTGSEFARLTQVTLAHQQYMAEMSAAWTGTIMRSGTNASILVLEKEDRRFAGAEWKQSRYHDFLRQAYLINTKYMKDLIEHAAVDDKARGRLRFFARQILDALSPSNYLATNPRSLRLALETGGDSLATGIKNLIEDIGKGQLSITDEKAFDVGVNLGVTPGVVVLENELIQLIQYRPLTEKVARRPLVIVPPAINKFYVFDLQPSNSFVRYAVEQGNTVFMISWRNISEDQGHLTWDDYLELGIMRAIDVALEITGEKQANVLGFCVGGTMLGCAAAVLAARRVDKIASLTFLATMLDFKDAGEIGLLIDERSVAMRERTIGQRRCHAGPGARLRLFDASRERFDLALCRQQLSRRAAARRLRYPLLERGQHQPARSDVLLVRAQHVSRKQLAYSNKDYSVRITSRSYADRRSHLRTRKP